MRGLQTRFNVAIKLFAYTGVLFISCSGSTSSKEDTKKSPPVAETAPTSKPVPSLEPPTVEKSPETVSKPPVDNSQKTDKSEKVAGNEQPSSKSLEESKANPPDTEARPTTKQDNSKPAASGDLTKGQEIFAKKCKGCHGDDGKGQTKIGLELKIPSLIKTKDSLAKITEIIRDGVPDTKMKAFRQKLSDEEIDAVAVYVKNGLR